ncbi:hypothetical protein HZA42_03210 [Candidatus Peregrinibacteria bacterium]|nr:hypothetical protein [Candidatus Peregrinibacteria bacterium]
MASIQKACYNQNGYEDVNFRQIGTVVKEKLHKDIEAQGFNLIDQRNLVLLIADKT